MSRESDGGEWHATTDRQRIVAWAEQREAVPVRSERREGETTLDVVSDPDDSPGEEIGWEEFFERFENEGLVFRYRESTEDESGRRTCEVVRPESLDDREAADEKVVPPDEVESEQIGASDTGEGEPVIYDRVEEDEGGTEDGLPGRKRDERGTGDTPGPKVDAEEPTEDRDGEETPMSESARDAEEPAIVLDEVYEDPGSIGSDPEDEYLVFENTGDEPIDLGGWSVESGDGRSYVFPTGFTLEAGQRVTLHSGSGVDTDADLYWGAEKSVWDPTGDTVELRTPGGDRAIREPIKDG